MKRCEGIPSDHPTAGVFIGTLLLNNPGAFASALTEELLSDKPIDERPIDNPELCRSLSQEAAYASEEGDDLDERRMVFWRGLHWAYTIAADITSPLTWPELRETPGGTDLDLDPDTRVRTIMRGGFDVCRNFNVTAGLARDCYPFVDPQGKYFKVAHFSVLAGFYLIDNGERQKQGRIEDNQRSLEQARTDIAFAKIKSAQEIETFAAISLDLTMDTAFNFRA